MSGHSRNGRRRSGFLPGLVFISSGFFAGFYGIDAMLSSLHSDETPMARESSFDFDGLITSSLGNHDFSAFRQQLAILLGTNHGEKTQEPKPMAVNRPAKVDRKLAGPLPKASQQNTIADLLAAKEASQPAVTAVTAERLAAVAPSGDPLFVQRNVTTPQGNRAAAQAQPATAPASLFAAPAAPVRAVLPPPPLADAAEVAMFAADMPLPARLAANAPQPRSVASATGYGVQPTPVQARTPVAAQPTHFSPLIPRTFGNGRAFGGLGEEEFQKRERRCLVTALYFEARGESDEGQIAVGQVIMNRVKSPDYPDTICGVVYQGSQRSTGCQFSFTCDGKADRPDNKAQWDRSVALANLVLEGKVWLRSIGDSTHYHANYVSPNWRREMDKKRKVGNHIFYKSPEVSVTAPYPLLVGEKRS